MLHKEDYSPKFGALISKSNVIIEGDVEKGSVLDVAGDLTIKGSSSDRIKVGGNLVVDGNIVGNGKRTVSVDGDVKASQIDNLRLMVRGNCNIDQYILRSNLVCGLQLMCNGFAANSRIYTGGSAKFEELGDENNNPCAIAIGVAFDKLMRFNRIQTRLDKVSGALVRAQGKLTQFQEFNAKLKEKEAKPKINQGFYGDTDKVPPKKLGPVKKYIARAEALVERLKGMRDQAKRKLEYDPNAMLVVNGTVYRNASVDVEKKYFCREQVGNVFFSNCDGKGNAPRPLAELTELKSGFQISSCQVPSLKERPLKKPLKNLLVFQS